MNRGILLAAAAAALGVGAIQAQPMIGSPSKGLEFARELCAHCHYVESDGPKIELVAPRSFVAIAKDAKTTETGLRVFLQSTHIAMPDFILTEEQEDDVVAYILSLKTARSAD